LINQKKINSAYNETMEKIMDNKKIEDLIAMEKDRYENIGLDYLTMFTVGELEKMDLNLSLENIVVAAYKLFPDKFSLLGFPKYPDAIRVEKCLWRFISKNKQWLGGKSHQGFYITDRSRVFIQKAHEKIFGDISDKKKIPSKTRRKEKILAEIVSTDIFRKYQKNLVNEISYSDFCYILQGTLDTSAEILYGNYIALKNIAEELNNSEIKKFLEFLVTKFRYKIKIKK
jgi:hypothetical protein